MNDLSCGATRVLAIDPTSKGIGFTVLEGPDQLLAWGVKHANKNGECLRRAAVLIARYRPDVLVVERTDDRGCRRRPRARKLIQDLLAFGRERGLRACQVPRRAVLRHFAGSGLATKRQVAITLSGRFPELEFHLPPERKPWMSEDPRMSIFDAIGFAVASFKQHRRPKAPPAALSAPRPAILTGVQ